VQIYAVRMFQFLMMIFVWLPLVALAGEVDQCGKYNSKSNPCPVSFYRLIASPDVYDGKFVRVVGFYPASGAKSIYINEDAAVQGDIVSSVLLDVVPNKPCGYHDVSGLFSRDLEDKDIVLGIYMPVGRLTSIEFFFFSRSLDRSCRIDEGSISYINGVIPVKGVK